MPALPTIGDLVAHDQHLEIYCQAPGCGTLARWTAAEAVARLGAACTFAQACRRLTCSACGERGRDGMISARPCVVDAASIRQAERAAREAQKRARTPKSGPEHGT